MKTCTFFGHREVIDDIKYKLYSIIEKLINEYNVERFYVGNQGGFDKIVISVLKEIKIRYEKIEYFIVLAYLPKTDENVIFENTVYPEGLEKTPLRYAIDKRNRYMIDKSQYVISYVKYGTGGANKYKKLSERKGLHVINIE